MAKKITKRQWELIKDEYNRILKQVVNELLDFRDKLEVTTKEADLKTFDQDEDFVNFGKAAIYWKIKVHHDQEAALEEVNNLLIITDDDYEEP